jgi:hypothetical protein
MRRSWSASPSVVVRAGALRRVHHNQISLGIFDKKYARLAAGSSVEHASVAPDLFAAETPLGTYQGMTDQLVFRQGAGRHSRRDRGRLKAGGAPARTGWKANVQPTLDNAPQSQGATQPWAKLFCPQGRPCRQEFVHQGNVGDP